MPERKLHGLESALMLALFTFGMITACTAVEETDLAIAAKQVQATSQVQKYNLEAEEANISPDLLVRSMRIKYAGSQGGEYIPMCSGAIWSSLPGMSPELGTSGHCVPPDPRGWVRVDMPQNESGCEMDFPARDIQYSNLDTRDMVVWTVPGAKMSAGCPILERPKIVTGKNLDNNSKTEVLSFPLASEARENEFITIANSAWTRQPKTKLICNPELTVSSSSSGAAVYAGDLFLGVVSEVGEGGVGGCVALAADLPAGVR